MSKPKCQINAKFQNPKAKQIAKLKGKENVKYQSPNAK
jgi:hypothetical protein